MNKTLYVKDKDLEIWEKAEAFAGGGIGQLIMNLLKQYVENCEEDERHAAAGLGLGL